LADYIYYNGELYHASKKRHKYIAKVPIGNNKYRYFYTKEEYRNYLAGKDSTKKDSKSKKNSVSKFFNKVFKNIEGLFKKSKKQISTTVDKGKQFVDEVIFGKTKSNRNKAEMKVKYTQRITLPNGKYKYFYSDEEYERYLVRQKYQKNEPDFMKKVPKIPYDKSYAASEDMAEINEDYSAYDDSRSSNCANCTIAYELRCRGYDVQAAEYKSKDSYIGAQKDYDNIIYKNADRIWLNQDGERDRVKGVLNKIGLKFKYQKDISYEPDTVKNAILKHSGKNTRGAFCVEWDSGGAHSMVYEVDKKGKVQIRDCQTNRIYNIEDVVDSVSRISITRTDNLEMQKEILKCVEAN